MDDKFKKYVLKIESRQIKTIEIKISIQYHSYFIWQIYFTIILYLDVMLIKITKNKI